MRNGSFDENTEGSNDKKQSRTEVRLCFLFIRKEKMGLSKNLSSCKMKCAFDGSIFVAV